MDTINNLAFNYRAAGQLDRAEPLLREVLAVRLKKEGPDTINTATALHSLAYVLLDQRNHAEAETVLRHCVAIRGLKLPDDWLTFSARSMLGDALLGQKKYAEAEPLLLQGYEGMKQRWAKIPAGERARFAEALERLVRLYNDWGKNDEADKWSKKLDAFGKRGGKQPE